MADQPTATVQIGEDTHEVPVDSLQLPDDYGLYGPDKAPEGFVRKEFMQSEIDRRLKGKADPDELLSDDEFFQKAAQKRGIELSDDLEPVSKIDPEKIQQMRQQWAAEQVDPLKEETEKLRGQVTSLRQRDLEREVLAAAHELGVKPELLKSPIPGKTAPFVRQLAEEFKYDDEQEVHYFTDEQGNPVYADNPSSGRPYAGPEKLLRQMKQGDEDNTWFTDQTQRGSGFQQGGQMGFNGSAVRIRREDARNSAKYRRAKKLAQEKGVEVEIVD
ncbi:MAG: hypothetical protein GVY18_18690 [Bacteroidetes bacterium]|jgi:hypothetical protein|nr:hypothetical protein [Bacteroidota bacterium]